MCKKSVSFFLSACWRVGGLCALLSMLHMPQAYAAPVKVQQFSSAQEVQALLQTMAQRTASIQSLYTTFVQEKKLAVLSEPLQAAGYMCMQKATAAAENRLVWAYTAPQESGFASLGEKNYHWNGSIQQVKPALGPEGMALKTISEHIRAWVQVNPEQLQKLYDVQGYVQNETQFLLLKPRHEQQFFTQLTAKLSPQLDGVKELIFTEKNGDSMRIVFAEPTRNEALPAPCRILPE